MECPTVCILNRIAKPEQEAVTLLTGSTPQPQEATMFEHSTDTARAEQPESASAHNVIPCSKCGVPVTRKNPKTKTFCSPACKAEWQRDQKPVGKEWLYQKYVVEGLGTRQIGALVGRNPKQVWH